MGHPIGQRLASACVVVLAVGLVAGGCDWYQLGALSGHAGDNSLDTTITPANVSTLTTHFTAADGSTSATAPQAVVNGILYARNAIGLGSYSASGTTGCSGTPAACTPLWTYSSGPSSGTSIAVANGFVYVSATSVLEAFDSAGQTNCSGTPKVCRPLWTASGTFGTPTVSNGIVYATATGSLDAFDGSGNTHCSGSPKVCSPIWTSGGAYGVVTVSSGIAYALTASVGTLGGKIGAFDANGVRGCAGNPRVCTPLWEYATNYPERGDYVVVSGNTVYVNTFYSPAPRQFTGDLEAFDANGVSGCGGTPIVCAPLWSDHNSFSLNTGPLVGAGSEFLSVPGRLGIFAFDPNGAPEWNTANATAGLAIGGAVLYGTDGTNVYAYDAGGTTGCSGSPKSCSSLWSAPGTGAIIANGTLYIGAFSSSGKAQIVAYGLP